MKISKLLSGVALLATIGVAASCGESKDTSLTNIEVWHYYSNKTETAFDTMVDEFNDGVGKEKNIFITPFSLNYVDELAKELVSSANGEVGSKAFPDMFMAYPDTAYELDLKGLVASLDNYYTKEELADYNNGFTESSRFGEGNHLKIMSVAKSTEAFFMNKTYFEQFLANNPDVDVSYDDLTTIEGVIKVAEEYYNKTGKAFYGRDSLSNYFVIGAKQLGIDLFSYDSNGKFVVNFNEEVFKKLWESYYVPFVKGYFFSQGKFRSTDTERGKILAYTASTSSAAYFPSKVIIDDNSSEAISSYVGFAPTFKDSKENYAVNQGAGFSVTKSTVKKEKACVEFIKWLSTEENIQKFSDLTSYFPAKTSAFTQSYIDSKEGIVKDTFNICKSSLSNSYMYTNTPSIKGASIREILDTTLDTAAREALNEIATRENNGESHDAAVANYITDAAFQTWFNALKQKINSLLN